MNENRDINNFEEKDAVKDEISDEDSDSRDCNMSNTDDSAKKRNKKYLMTKNKSPKNEGTLSQIFNRATSSIFSNKSSNKSTFSASSSSNVNEGQTHLKDSNDINIPET
ncbi:hypothetical protein ACKWTF_006379 [Chironomus riparius]